MTIKSIQKVIKVGDSLATTIPAKDARAMNIKAGDNVVAAYTPMKNNDDKASDAEVLEAAKKMLSDYKQDFDNLAQR